MGHRGNTEQLDKREIIIKIPKKGDLTVCDNSRGVTLVSVPGKIFGKVLIYRIN